MARIDLDLTPINQARRDWQALLDERRLADAGIAAMQFEVDAAERRGASANELGELRGALAQARDERQQLAERLREAGLAVDGLADVLLAQRDPALMAQALDGAYPIALLPVRLETRYFPPEAPTRLRVRVYPDDIHTVEHTPLATDDERRRGFAYWTARFAGDAAEAERIARDLTLVYGRGRAAWVQRVTTPENIDRMGQPAAPGAGNGNGNGNGDGGGAGGGGGDGGGNGDGGPGAAPALTAPRFPDLQTVAARSKQTRALLLPDRWCVIGYGAGRREVFRAWGQRIPDELLLSPDWLHTGDPEGLFGGERAWLADFDAAVTKGMALEITQQDADAHARRNGLARPFQLATQTIERLLVVGLEWTKNPATSADELADLLAAQRDAQGFGFVPLGTPTNNTDAARSGYSRGDERSAAPLPPAAAAPEEADALQLLTRALGLPLERLPAAGIAGAHLDEQRTALHMLNLLWRGTFGHYLMELWNPPGDEAGRFLKTPTLYALRRYVVAHLRPAGPLPLLRVGKQPYGVLPVVGRGFVGPGDRGAESAVEAGIGKVLAVLRPMWEIASRKLPLMKDGDLDVAKDILQTGPWSQAAFYRDKEADKAICRRPGPFGDSQVGAKGALVKALLNALGIGDGDWLRAHIYSCTDFLPDTAYPAAYLAGVPWVQADAAAPQHEAPDDAPLGPGAGNYLSAMADALARAPSQADAVLNAHQEGPALLQALAAYSVLKERGDAVEGHARGTSAVSKVASLATPKMLYVEAAHDNESVFNVTSPKELAQLSIPALTGNATLGEHVARSLAAQPVALAPAHASLAASALVDSVARLTPKLRDLGAVKLSLQFLATRTVGDLNHALRTTLDAFSYRLDAWYTARASRRLDQMRNARPAGVHVGGYAWVENLKADRRPDSDGHLLAPSPAHAATAAILRSGFSANHERGAFNVNLDSRRTQRAQALLQGLTRDQPLAALYGYRIERGLRDALLGKFIWPLRLAYPWRAAGAQTRDEPQEAVAARDVVDGVALLADWEAGPGTVRARLAQAMAERPATGAVADDPAWGRIATVIRDAADLADAVSDLLLAESTHQIVQGNFERAGAAMAVADKQTLPVEMQVARTPRGGASYTQRIALVCPPVAARNEGWPQDRRSRTEPGLDAWVARMLGDPSRWRFSARVHRRSDGANVIDAAPATAGFDDLGLSPLSAVLLATGPASGLSSSGEGGTGGPAAAGETGLRSRLVDALVAAAGDRASIVALDVAQEGADGALGLGHFEAMATTLRAVIDGARVMTRKDVVVPDDKLEGTLPDEGEYPGIDRDELLARAQALAGDFATLSAALDASDGVDAWRAALSAMDDFLPRAAWPPQVQAIDAAGADPATRGERIAAARAAVKALLDAKQAKLDVPITPPAGRASPTHGQQVQNAIDRVQLLLGRNFPLLPLFRLGPYAATFNAPLADQGALTVGRPWCVAGWLPKLARVREGADRLAAALAAHDALIALPSDAGFGDDPFRLLQYPHRAGRAWAALPEAWREPEGTPPDTSKVPEELHAYLADRPGAPYRDVQRAAPNLAIALHAPGGLDAVDGDTALSGLVCDEWPEFIPDPYQTAAIAFHYDAPGARPPQSVLLAVPPRADQANWQFDEVLDALHETWDLARLRGVRPRDLEGGLGLLLPGNYLPQAYTDDLPSVRLLKLMQDARAKLVTAASKGVSLTLGKV